MVDTADAILDLIEAVKFECYKRGLTVPGLRLTPQQGAALSRRFTETERYIYPHTKNTIYQRGAYNVLGVQVTWDIVPGVEFRRG